MAGSSFDSDIADDVLECPLLYDGIVVKSAQQARNFHLGQLVGRSCQTDEPECLQPALFPPIALQLSYNRVGVVAAGQPYQIYVHVLLEKKRTHIHSLLARVAPCGLLLF